LTGADKVYNVGELIYIQFKKSEGLRPWDARPKRKNHSKLQEVREFRHAYGLADTPSLFFRLRAPAEHALDLQHNVLLSYDRPPHSHAIYVAPLMLDSQSYSRSLFDSSDRYLGAPFFFRNYRVVAKSWVSLFGAIPFLRAHISIRPHERVASDDHYYAFASSGADVSWHSPAVISRDVSRLSDFLFGFFRNTLLAPDGMLPLDRLAELIEPASLPHARFIKFQGPEPLDRIANHGRWLHQNFGIRQFVLLGNAHELNEWRRIEQ
jgi:hypothetical protein